MTASNRALQVGKTLRLLDWVEVGLKDRVASLEQGLTALKEKYQKLQAEVDAEAETNVTDRLQGIEIPDAERKRMLRDTQKTLWGNKGGNRLHAELKSSETAVGPAAQATKDLIADVARRREELNQPAAVTEAEEVLRSIAANAPVASADQDQ